MQFSQLLNKVLNSEHTVKHFSRPQLKSSVLEGQVCKNPTPNKYNTVRCWRHTQGKQCQEARWQAASHWRTAIPQAQSPDSMPYSELPLLSPPRRPLHPQRDTVIKSTWKNTTILQRAGRLFGDFSCSCTAALGGNMKIGKDKKGKGSK